MGVDDEVAHMGVVHGRLSPRPPSPVRLLIAGIGADEIDLGEVAELDAGDVFELATDDEVEQLLVRHGA